MIMMISGLEGTVDVVLFYPPVLQIRKPQPDIIWHIHTAG